MDYIVTKDTNTDELQHYGVKGMKWGVRKSVKQLANHHRNVAIKSAKNEYRKGNISKADRNAAIKNAKAGKKKYLEETKKNFESLPNRAAKKEASKNITSQRVSTVPHSRVKRGVRFAKNILTGAAVGSSVSTAVLGTALNPAFGGMILASHAVYSSAILGASWLGGKVLDRLE